MSGPIAQMQGGRVKTAQKVKLATNEELTESFSYRPVTVLGKNSFFFTQIYSFSKTWGFGVLG